METNVEQILAMIPADSMLIVPTTMLAVYVLKSIHPKLKENAQLLAIIIGLGLSITMIPDVPLLNRILIGFALAISSMKAHDLTKILGTAALKTMDMDPEQSILSGDADIPDAVSDVPDSRDWRYEEMFGSVEVKPSVLCNGTPVLNQGALLKTKMACTRFGMVKSINEMNYLDNDPLRIDPVKEWDLALAKYGASQDKGATLQSAVKQMKDQGYITGYTLLAGPGNTDIEGTKRKVMEAMSQGIMLFSGSQRINRSETKKKGYAVIGTGSGHAFAMTGYLKEGIMIPNSYGDRAHGLTKPLGYFILKWEDVGALFSIYALLDKKQIKKVEEMKVKVGEDDAIIKQAVDLGITNGTDLDSPATRRQVITMIMRSLK